MEDLHVRFERDGLGVLDAAVDVGARDLHAAADRRHAAAILTGRSGQVDARIQWMVSRERDGELAAWLEAHPPTFVEQMVTVRWPGAAEPVG